MSLSRAGLSLGGLWPIALLLGACFPAGGHELVQGSQARAPTPPGEVILYGVEGQGAPPPGCRGLGVVRAWSPGEKTFPYGPFREAAGELGGDSVVDIRPDPEARDRRRPTHLGSVALCRAPR